MPPPASLSIVVPCHNEVEALPSTYETLRALADRYKREGLITSFELVLVNNGSTDDTIGVMRGLFERDSEVLVVDLRKNFGYQGSITAGLFAASKEMVVSIDADLQDDPEKIREMIEKYYAGFEMVLGVRTNRDQDSFFKRQTARAFYWTLNRLGVHSVPHHGDFRLLSRAIVEELKKFPERVRYLRGLIFEVESRYACVSYTRRARELGTSKFTVRHLFSLAFDGITSFSAVPIRLLSVMGLVTFALSILGLLFVLWVKFVWRVNVPGWAFLAVIIFFFSGIQSLTMGVIGEYIAKMYLEAKQRPVYIVRKMYRHLPADPQ